MALVLKSSHHDALHRPIVTVAETTLNSSTGNGTLLIRSKGLSKDKNLGPCSTA